MAGRVPWLLVAWAVVACGDPAGPSPNLRIQITLGSSAVALGRATTASATIVDSVGAPVSGTVVWTSTNRTAATIASDGAITPHAIGETMIVATSGKTTASAALRVVQPYVITILDTAESFSLGINAGGDVVGWAWERPPVSSWRGRMWTGQETTDLGDFLPIQINASRTILGSDSIGGGNFTLPALPAPSVFAPRLWIAGSVARLAGIDTVKYVRAYDVDDAGRVALAGATVVYLWQSGTLNALGGAVSYVGHMNNRGEVAGSFFETLYQRAVLWRVGGATTLGGLEGRYSAIWAANDSGYAIGFAEKQPLKGSASYYWDGEGQQLDFAPRDLNNGTQIVGQRNPADAILLNTRPTAPLGAGQISLAAIIPPGDWLPIDAVAINDRGQIAGKARNTFTGRIAAMRLDPTPLPR
jgi:hypothetical protein